MDWITGIPVWMQVCLIIGMFFILGILAAALIFIIRKGFKLKNIEVGMGKNYLTVEDSTNLFKKVYDSLKIVFSITYDKKPRDQSDYVDQINIYIKEIIVNNYKKMLNGNLPEKRRHELLKAYELVIRLLLREEKYICQDEFKKIHGSLKDVSLAELNNPDSEIVKEIIKKSDYMIKVASEIINEWYIELDSGIDRKSLMDANMPIVPAIKGKIQDALKKGYKIHVQYEEKIKAEEDGLAEYMSGLLNKNA